ncbi:hypothetical protein [Paenibacillus alginolyticus]|uniref:Secreted protein n=1 Tax=Paenibacillus alginolyticus TaxID=59839 RepID=A0ABT4GIH5_9BACL|nr:hypothetical protein [Paenibacillus alginolyticus]MCY9695981.1 hypothetical protein [Paenibacillus alginolyticus]MEC0148302.1 hypothetical protein [Paenibacillus alginolyticus]
MKKIGVILLTLAILLSACGKAATTDHSARSENKEQGHAGHESSESAADTEGIQAVFKLSPDPVQAKQETEMTIQILDKNGKSVDDFDLNHEKKMHLILVSQDLAYYKHLHPTYQGKGLFTIRAALPAGGNYKLFADFKPSGLAQIVKSYVIKAGGEAAPSKALQPDSKLTATVNGMEISLAVDHLMAGMDLDLTYTFKDAATKAPITNLQPYLGAVGHVVILDEKADQYLHVHPVDEKSAGPEAKFKTSFPKSGIYKIWGEFQRDGQVITVPFVVKVP